jgi:hypothetical protein
MQPAMTPKDRDRQIAKGYWHWSRFRGMARDDRGTSLLEMALLTPVLLLILLGVIEIGRYAELSIVVANAARAGVQYGAQNLATAADSTGIQNAALNDGQNIPGLQVNPPADGYLGGYVLCGCSAVPPPDSTCPAVNCGSHGLVYVQVDATGTFSSLFHYPGIPSSITVNSTAQMQVAQ